MKKTLRTLALLLLMVMVLSACGKPEGGGDVVEPTPTEKVLTIAQWNPPTGLFVPDILLSSYDSSVTGLIYEPMMDYDENMEFKGLLAESWEVSDDNLSVTFHLRKDVTWHDGVPFTAEDVKWTLMFVGHKDYTGPRYSNVEKILGMPEWKAGTAEDVTGIEILDPHTIKITTSEIFASFYYSIGGRDIMPKHIWENVDIATLEKNTAMVSNPIGTGPFKFSEFVPDSHVIAVANKEYWAGSPKIDKVIIKAVSQDTANAQIINGEIDIMDLSNFNPDVLKTLTDAKVELNFANSVTAQYMGVNNRLEYFKDNRVRQAMACAINRQQIVDQLLYGRASVLNNPYTPSSFAKPDDSKMDMYAYDKDRAIALLTSVEGFTYNAKDNVMLYKGKPVKWELKYPIGNKAREASATVIQQNLKDIGIEIDLRLLEFAALSDALNKREFDLFLIGMGTSFDADQKYIWETDATYNYCGWADKKTDQMLDQGLKFIDVADRQAVYEEWAIYMNEMIPNVWLYNPQSGVAFADRLENFVYGTSGYYHNMQDWDIK